jgi:uncharacterized protein (DUF486 family)
MGRITPHALNPSCAATPPIEEPTLPAIPLPPAWLVPIVLLTLSNVFMTLAWYGHLKFKDQPLMLVIVVSWGIAFIEYCLAVPANRIGHGTYTAAELKTMQEVITLVVFAVFSITYLGEKITINHIIGFSLIVAGAYFVFKSPL